MSAFTHPLARDAKIWPSGGLSGQVHNMLVIITSLELNAGRPRFKPKQVERLTTAARDWIRDNPESAADFVLMNRPKTWAGDKGSD